MSFYLPYRLVKLSTQTASSSANISFTSLINSNYSTYYVKIRGMRPATNNTNLTMVLSTNNGSSYLSANYNWAWFLSDSTNSNVQGGSASQSSFLAGDSQNNGSSSSFDGDYWLYNMNSTTFHPSFQSQSSQYTGSNSEYIQISGHNTTTTAVTAVRFLMSSGNITAGTFIFYGVQNL